MIPGDRTSAGQGYLEAMGSHLLHVGPVGSGTAMKLARSLMHFVAFTAATGAQRLTEAAGLDLKILGDMVMTGTLTLRYTRPLPLGEVWLAGSAISLSGDEDAVLRGWWDALAEGGTVKNSLEAAPWGDVFGQLIDRFGIHWMFNIAGPGQ